MVQFILILVFPSVTYSQSILPEQLSPANDLIPLEIVPDAAALLGWRKSTNNGMHSGLFLNLRNKEISCEDKKLYPTHPGMTLKSYHLVYIGRYQVSQLQRTSQACKIVSPTQTNLRCMIADDIYHYIISDTYRDRCGNFYRGFARKVFMKRSEKMETLFSLGRRVIKTPRSSLPGDYSLAGTSFVDSSEFLKLTELFPGDLSHIEGELLRLKQVPGIQLDLESLLYQVQN